MKTAKLKVGDKVKADKYLVADSPELKDAIGEVLEVNNEGAYGLMYYVEWSTSPVIGSDYYPCDLVKVE